MARLEGDEVEEGQTIVEVSTDKVDAEVPAPASGTVTKILVGPDETIEVGEPLEIDPNGGPPEKMEKPAAEQEAESKDPAAEQEAESNGGGGAR